MVITDAFYHCLLPKAAEKCHCFESWYIATLCSPRILNCLLLDYAYLILNKNSTSWDIKRTILYYL